MIVFTLFAIGITAGVGAAKLTVNDTVATSLIGMAKAGVLQSSLGYGTLGGFVSLRNPGDTLDLLAFNGASNPDDFINTGRDLAIGSTVANDKVDITGNARVSGHYKVGVNQVLGARVGGWTVPTGTMTRTDFTPATVTLPALAEQVNALKNDFHAAGHGAIGV